MRIEQTMDWKLLRMSRGSFDWIAKPKCNLIGSYDFREKLIYNCVYFYFFINLKFKATRNDYIV